MGMRLNILYAWYNPRCEILLVVWNTSIPEILRLSMVTLKLYGELTNSPIIQRAK